LLKHRLLDEGDVRRALPREALDRIEAHVAASEQRHTGQIRVCVEAGLPLGYVRRGASARDRAVAMFAKLRVWDTEQNNGVLVYLLMAERAIEVVADRALDRRVDRAEWRRVADAMQPAFRAGQFEAGVTEAIDAVDAILARHFPRAVGQPRINELPDAPVIG